MLSSSEQKLDKLDAFYRLPLAKQKTSAEIISEARNALRTVRTQRPFTPREDQRKLFGPASSRTPENRPPSSFRNPKLQHLPTQRRMPISPSPKLQWTPQR
uniref:Armadillo repeat containing 2 n=1 Tax=Rattus norvegicus TaxID=10116 RepID=A0A8I6A0V3_RAT